MEDSKKDGRFISFQEASKEAGVSRQAIYKIKNNGPYNFFENTGTKEKPRWKVDTYSAAWKEYLIDRKNNDNIKNKKSPVSKIKSKSSQLVKQKKSVQENKKKRSTKKRKLEEIEIFEEEENFDQVFEYDENFALTGGVDLSQFPPRTLAEGKAVASITKLNIEIETMLKLLIDKELVVPVFELLGQIIKTDFIDPSAKIARRVCAEVDRIGMEKSVEKIIDNFVTKGIKNYKDEVSKAIRKINKLK